MRRLQAVAAPRHRPRLDRREMEPSLGIGCDPPEATEIRVERLVGLRVLGMRVAAGGIRLPDLDDRIRHRRPVAIEDAPRDDDALSLRVAARQVIPFRAVEPERKKWPNRL